MEVKYLTNLEIKLKTLYHFPVFRPIYDTCL
jgi:hypothetical protein